MGAAALLPETAPAVLVGVGVSLAATEVQKVVEDVVKETTNSIFDETMREDDDW